MDLNETLSSIDSVATFQEFSILSIALLNEIFSVGLQNRTMLSLNDSSGIKD